MTPRRFLQPWVIALALVACGKKTPPASSGDAATVAPASADAGASSTSSESASTDSASSETTTGEAATTETAAPPKGKTAEDRRLEIAPLLQSGDEADALSARGKLEALVDKHPDDARAWYDLGVARYRLGAIEDAADAFTKATRKDESLGAAWRALGACEAALGDPDTALRRYDRALEIDPEDIDAYAARIAALVAAGRAREAITTAKAALNVNANSLDVYNHLGLAHLALDELELARFVYEKAQRLEGAEDDAAVQANYGWTQYRLGEKYTAQHTLERATTLDPGYVPGLVYLARVYLDDRNFGDMLPLLESAKNKDPENHGVLMNLGIAYRGVGRFDDAMRSFERAYDLQPRDPSPLFNLGIVLGDDLKRYDESVRHFERYIEAGGTEVELATTYIDEVQREQKKAEALQRRREAAAKREAERAKREALLKEQETPAEEPAKEEPASPWGSTGDGGAP